MPILGSENNPKVLHMSETKEEIFVPEMIGLDLLTKVIVAYLKAGGDKDEKGSEEVAQISGVNANNVGLNNKFLASIGFLEGRRGAYKLTVNGAEYARALDWGRLDEAQIILRKTIKEKPLVSRTVSYVELNRPVNKDDLIGKIATFAGVPNEQRYSTGIRAFIEMLTLSGLLAEDKDGKITAKEKETSDESALRKSSLEIAHPKKEGRAQAVVPINVTISIDDNTDPEKLKALIRALLEALAPTE